MKIVNLTSGKLPSRFSQKGTKGPLHCVPPDVQDTITTLPRPLDKSMMIRLQLKRRLQYKAIWEEQLINPHDINEIDDNYLTSDKDNNVESNTDSLSETMDVDTFEKEDSIEEIAISNENHLETLALGDIDNNNSDEEIDEDNNDIRTKYNIDKTIEALAFPHLFPDGNGSFDEERETILKWKEYCKTRLFSSDSRFAPNSSYIFYLQYLDDLKQVFSGINIAFRKKLPMNAKQSLDETQMKFLMNKDMIYRHLQCVRGSPQYWLKRLKDLLAMTRQIGFPTFFLTLSCADLRWKEFVDNFVRPTGGIIKESYTFEEKTLLLRANPVLVARLFERRFTSLMNLFIKGGAWCLGKVKDWFSRMEMQLRGSSHSHMSIWVDNAPKYNGPHTDEKTRLAIVTFCDKYITTRFPSLNEDAKLHNLIKEVQTHSRNHLKSCLKYNKTMCRFGFPRPVARRTFICEPLKIDNDDDKQRIKNIKKILTEMNATMNVLEKEKILTWSDFDDLFNKYNWLYDDYEYALRVVHTRTIMIHKREPNARWVNQYNEEILRVWNANMDIQFVLDPYAYAKYLMSYTTKPEREMSLLLEETHKVCREGNMSVRDEMKKLAGTFFNHRQVSVQEAIYRATKMPLTYSSRGFLFVPAHSNSCKFLKPYNILKEMDPDDENIYMSNLADKCFDRPNEPEFNICMADFASEYEILSINKKVKQPKTPIKRLQTLNFAIKKRCNRNAIIRYPYFNRETDTESYYENLLSLYLPIRSEIFDNRQQSIRKVKDIVYENQRKYEAHLKETDAMMSLFNESTENVKEDEWSEIVANLEKNQIYSREIEQEDNPDFNTIHKSKHKNTFIEMKQTFSTTNEIRPLLDSMNHEQQEIFYYVRE
ncbi:unnamed protein product [Rotaria magnacalcarata]|uniref:Helitron helicase-like domain-containing protein n=1 Tax=Rotaria magnacalcarata TaxID=392030 RepID=A0A816SKX4_9BILA|nr:unnamed protein product [Rotaria magnacalcarata]